MKSSNLISLGILLLASIHPLLHLRCQAQHPVGNSAVADKPASSYRQDAARRAAVWREPPIPVERYDFLNGEPAADGFDAQAELSCRWEVKEYRGWTPKFHCLLPSGESVQVKYHSSSSQNPEVPAEIVASRLLRALGFGADRMYTVKALNCIGCPEEPFKVLQGLFHKDPKAREQFLRENGSPQGDGSYVYTPDFTRTTQFRIVSLERPMEGSPIQDYPEQGFGFHELEDPEYAGSSRAQVDALKLLNAFLNNSDTTVKNQALVCLDANPSSQACRRPFVSIQDVGAVLGAGLNPDGLGLNKFDLQGWKRAEVWRNEKRCRLKINGIPHATFPDGPIGEAGRAFLANLLQRLSREQIADLFRGAKTYAYMASEEDERKVLEAWVDAFVEKRRAITEKKEPCP